MRVTNRLASLGSHLQGDDASTEDDYALGAIFADKHLRQGFASGELAVLLVVILPIDHDNCAHAFEISEGAVAGDSWNSANEPYARRHKDPELACRNGFETESQ